MMKEPKALTPCEENENLQSGSSDLLQYCRFIQAASADWSTERAVKTFHKVSQVHLFPLRSHFRSIQRNLVSISPLSLSITSRSAVDNRSPSPMLYHLLLASQISSWMVPRSSSFSSIIRRVHCHATTGAGAGAASLSAHIR